MIESLASLLKLVPFLLRQLEKERGLALVAERELESLKEAIGATGRFLEKANSMEVINEELKESMKRARRFLYASEDAIDDFMRQSSLEWEGLVTHFLLHYNRRTFASVVEDIKMMADEFVNMERTAVGENLRASNGDHSYSRLGGRRSSFIAYSEERDDALVGIGRPRNQLVNWLTEKPSMSKVIFVHGPRGVGKASLVGAVLRDRYVKRRFKYYVWIKGLRSCQSGEDRAAALMNANAKILDLTKGEGTHQRRLEEAFTLMKADKDVKANKRSWVLVMDDAIEADVVKSLLSRLKGTRPSVLVTTHITSLASATKHILDSNQGATYDFHDFKHDLLCEVDSRSLFHRKMLPLDSYRDDLRDASDRIVKECGGLPLTILETCKFIICKPPSASGTPDSVKWKKLSRRLREALLSNGYKGGPIGRMGAPCMDTLLDVHSFLFYLSIFPLGCPIRCSTMMRLWMAEGFIEQEGTQPVQEKAEETLEKLLDHNQIMEKKKTSYGRVKTCCVDYLYHQQQISTSINEELAMIVDSPEPRWPENVWHLSFCIDMDRTYDEPWVQQLRSLIVFKKVLPTSLKKLLEKAKRLKVLDLQEHSTKKEKHYRRASLDTFPKKILQSKYLRYLSLRGTNIKIIPKDIEDLAYLETLDLRCTLVDQLPDGILKLTALRHLLVSRSKKSQAAKTDLKLGVKVPSKLGVLTSLQKLCMIELGQDKQSRWRKKAGKGGQLLEELGKLANLRRLGISMLKSTDVKLLCCSILNLRNLETLRLIAAERERIDLSKEDQGKAPEYLQRVHLTGCLGTLPTWILRPDSLVKLVLKGSQLTEDPLQHLGNFWCLKHLELDQAFNVYNMKFEAGKFQELCFLGLYRFDELVSIQVGKGALPTLERLSLARCKSLTTVPQFSTRPTKLKCLKLYDMPEKFNTAVKKFIQDHKSMEVKFRKWKDEAVEEVIRIPRHSAGGPSWIRRHSAGGPSAPPPSMK